MGKFYSRYRRGDVWFLYFPSEVQDGVTSAQKKSKPYLIVSCEENNNCASTLNVVPISTRSNDHIPAHVYFRIEPDPTSCSNQLILCDQITTIGVDAFTHPKSYFMFSLSVDLMNQVDTALAGQFGLNIRVGDMHILENLINKIAAQKEADIKSLRDESLKIEVNRLAASLAKRFGVDLDAADMLNGLTYSNSDLEYAPAEVVTDLRATAKERTTEPALVVTAVSKQTAKKKSKKRASRNIWTEETKQQYMNDYNNHSVEFVMKKYHLTRRSAQSLAWQLRRDLRCTET